MKTATFGAGCFWGVEEAFRQLEGVTTTAVGYTGGSTDAPTYKEVCTDKTGHAEVTQVEYDPSLVAYEQLLELFWSIHDPTQVNRQGPDIGTQYRSVIFFHDEEQESAARASLSGQDASGRYPRAIATQIVPATRFHRAEEVHQQYIAKRGFDACATKIRPNTR